MPDLSFENSTRHQSACPCCSGSDTRNFVGKDEDDKIQKQAKDSEQNAYNDRSTIARDNLLNEWFTSFEVTDKAAEKRKTFQDRYDVKIDEKDGKYIYSYRADGKTHELLQSEANEKGLTQAAEKLDLLTKEKISTLEKDFKVTFAEKGEPVARSYRLDADCKRIDGEIVYATTPSLRLLHATELALQQSQPSQLTFDGKDGLKISIADGRPVPQIYGGRWPLGYQKPGYDGKKPSVIVTLDGSKLPATEKDTSPDGRNLKWVMSHEFTHNSQNNNWEDGLIPKDVLSKLGWSADHIMKDGKAIHQWQFAVHGKKGEFYGHLRADCKSPSVWFLSKEDTTPIDKNGNEVKSLSEAPHFSNEEMMQRTKVKPNTYYFMNPREMHSEGLTGFKFSKESRAQLLKDSPQLYDTAKEYDQQELNHFYGKDRQGNPKMLRMPDGKIVPRSNMAERAIKYFEGRY